MISQRAVELRLLRLATVSNNMSPPLSRNHVLWWNRVYGVSASATTALSEDAVAALYGAIRDNHLDAVVRTVRAHPHILFTKVQSLLACTEKGAVKAPVTYMRMSLSLLMTFRSLWVAFTFVYHAQLMRLS